MSPFLSEFSPGALVRARGREWVVQPGSTIDALSLRPLGGSEDDIATVAHLGPGASVGEMSMIDGRRRFASCKTAEPTDFAVLSSRNLHEILHSAPRLGNKFLLLLLQMMARRLRDTSNNLMPHITGVTV